MQDVEHELTAQERSDNKALAEGAIVDIEVLTHRYQKNIKSMLKALSALGEGEVSTDIEGDDFFDEIDRVEDKLGLNIKKQFKV